MFDLEVLPILLLPERLSELLSSAEVEIDVSMIAVDEDCLSKIILKRCYARKS